MFSLQAFSNVLCSHSCLMVILCFVPPNTPEKTKNNVKTDGVFFLFFFFGIMLMNQRQNVLQTYWY